ncbi:hypothetical protein [Streptomyces sp. SM14]|nr:hypothetical protein [Streptomyces sp. SM14]
MAIRVRPPSLRDVDGVRAWVPPVRASIVPEYIRNHRIAPAPE